MPGIKKKRVFSLIAAFLFAFVAVCTFILKSQEFRGAVVFSLLFVTPYLLFSVFLFLQNKIGVTVACCLPLTCRLLELCITIYDNVTGYYFYQPVWYPVLFALPYIALLVVLILTLAKKRVVRYIWFVPAVFRLLTDGYKGHDLTSFIGYGFIVLDLLLLVGYIILGLWLRESVPKPNKE